VTVITLMVFQQMGISAFIDRTDIKLVL